MFNKKNFCFKDLVVLSAKSLAKDHIMKNKTNAGKLFAGNIFVFWGWSWWMCRNDRIRKEGNRGKGVDNSAGCYMYFRLL